MGAPLNFLPFRGDCLYNFVAGLQILTATVTQIAIRFEEIPTVEIPSLDELYSRPGFMVRRAQQIATSLFETALGDLNMSPTQFAALYILNKYPEADQITLGGLLGIDRSTTTVVLRSLEDSGQIVRKQSAADRRRKLLKLTNKGRTALRKAEKVTKISKHRILAPFTPEEAEVFQQLLKKLVISLNEDSRAPITWPATSTFNSKAPEGKARER